MLRSITLDNAAIAQEKRTLGTSGLSMLWGFSAEVPGSPAASATQRGRNGAADGELGPANTVKRWYLELSMQKQNGKLPSLCPPPPPQKKNKKKIPEKNFFEDTSYEALDVMSGAPV